MRRQQSRRNVRPSMATCFLSLPEEQDLNSNVYLFTRDIQWSIMPAHEDTNEPGSFTATLEGTESECEKAKVIIGDMGGHGRNSTSEMICDAVKKMAGQLSLDGQIFYEIIKNDDETHISWFPSENLFRVFSWYLQIIPAGDRNLWERTHTLISEKKVWSIQIPNRLGGRRKHKKIIKKLRSHPLVPRFYKQGLEIWAISNSYDHTKYMENNEIYTNRAANKWGWNRKGSSTEGCTEFYMVYKMLSLRWAQAVLREHLINEIDQLLNRLAINCKIVVTGLPTEDEIQQARNDLKNGKIDFGEAFNKTRV